MSAREAFAAANVRLLTAQFAHYLEVYDRHPPFRPEAHALHVETLRRRGLAGSAVSALEDEPFLRSLYATLKAWQIGQRGSRLWPFERFRLGLRAQRAVFADLDGMMIDDPNLDVDRTVAVLRSLIRDIGIVDNKAPLVAGAKAIHHILPDLVAPIDRRYTRPFFGWYSSQFQYRQEAACEEIFRTYHQVATSVDLDRHIKDGWRTARAKLLDNAVVGFCIEHNVKRS